MVSEKGGRCADQSSAIYLHRQDDGLYLLHCIRRRAMGSETLHSPPLPDPGVPDGRNIPRTPSETIEDEGFDEPTALEI